MFHSFSYIVTNAFGYPVIKQQYNDLGYSLSSKRTILNAVQSQSIQGGTAGLHLN